MAAAVAAELVRLVASGTAPGLPAPSQFTSSMPLMRLLAQQPAAAGTGGRDTAADDIGRVGGNTGGITSTPSMLEQILTSKAWECLMAWSESICDFAARETARLVETGL